MSVPEGYKSLGKIGISYKGDYNSNTAYERLDAVFHNGSTYLAIKDAPDGAPRDDKTNWIYLAKGYDGETVDVADSEIAFTDSETRENIVSGEKVSTVFGKIKKFFTDLTAPAFAQMITSADDLLATKVTGYVPDAKAVADGFADVNGKLQWNDWTQLPTSQSQISIYYRYNVITTEITVENGTYTTSASSESEIAQLPLNLRPLRTIYMTGTNGLQVRIESSGSIKITCPNIYTRGFISYGRY